MLNSIVSNHLRNVMLLGVTALLAVTVMVMVTNDSVDTVVSKPPVQAVANTVFVPPMVSPATGKTIEIVEVPNETVYTGGPVAYVDFSVDKTFGDCVAVWYPAGRFANCADATEGWQTVFPRSVPAGTDASDIMLSWNDKFAPDNWR
jgi:hypothetical protein